VVERGTHAELLARRGRYHEMYTKQHGVESNLFLAPGEGDKPPGEGERPAEGAEAASASAPSGGGGLGGLLGGGG
jgi:subfamily B ATP-binding cassette protein MsbA